MTLQEAKDIFMNETSWSHGCFEEQCIIHSIEPEPDEWFGMTASRLWSVLPENEQEEFRKEFEEYYGSLLQ